MTKSLLKTYGRGDKEGREPDRGNEQNNAKNSRTKQKQEGNDGRGSDVHNVIRRRDMVDSNEGGTVQDKNGKGPKEDITQDGQGVQDGLQGSTTSN